MIMINSTELISSKYMMEYLIILNWQDKQLTV